MGFHLMFLRKDMLVLRLLTNTKPEHVSVINA